MELELQREIVRILKGDIAVASFVGDKIYDRVPDNQAFPFVQLGEFQSFEDDSDCYNSLETFVTIHAWSRTFGSVECKNIVNAIRSALHESNFTVTGGNVVECRCQQTRVFLDADGETSHGVITLRILSDQI